MSASDNANCTITRTCRRRVVLRPPVRARPASLSAAAGFDRRTKSAGATPAATVAARARPVTKATILQSTPTSSVIGSPKLDIKGTVQLASQTDTTSAADAPTTPSSRVSIMTCRTSRPRRAPSAARTAISCERSVARVTSRFATFAHATMSTSNAAPSNTRKGDPVACGSIESPSRPEVNASTIGRGRPARRATSPSTAFRSAAARSSPTPERRRPITVSQLDVRFGR